MTDIDSGMEPSARRSSHAAARTLASGALLAALVAVAGCGGSKSNAVPPSVSTNAGPGGVVAAQGTLGLVGPAGRATRSGAQFSDRTSKIPATSNRRTGALRHGVAGGAACDNGGITPAADNLDQVNAAVFCLVNAERTDQGLAPLSQNSQLQQSAAGMAQRIVTEQFFAHETPDGKNLVDRIRPTGYIPRNGDWVVGENLAWGSGGLSTPQAIVNAWMNSPGHRANILAPDYKDIGLATAIGSPTKGQSGGAVYVNNFGARSGADLTAVLPSKESSGSATTAGKQKVAARRKAAARRRAAAKRKARHRHRRHHRHRRRH